MRYVYERYGLFYDEVEGVYPVREDTLFMVEAIEPILESSKGRLLEMGCGTALLTLVGAHLGWDVISIDREPGALLLLRSNLEKNSLNADIFLSDLFDGIPRSYMDHDIMAFNPPYLHDIGGGRKEMPLSGGKKGYETALRFLKGAVERAGDPGRIFLIASSQWDDGWDQDVLCEQLEVETIRRMADHGEDLILRCYSVSGR